MFLNEDDLETRDTLIRYFTRYLGMELNKVNSAFRFIRIETPILLPYNVEKESQRSVQICLEKHDLVLRQSTALGAYDASRNLLASKTPKHRLPLVVWQHGKVFQQVKKHVKEVYNLEYQVLFSKTTGVQYLPNIVRCCESMLRKQCGKIFKADEDDTGLTIFTHDTDVALVHIRERTDFWSGRNIEIVFNMDDCITANTQHEFGKIRRVPIDKH